MAKVWHLSEEPKGTQGSQGREDGLIQGSILESLLAHWCVLCSIISTLFETERTFGSPLYFILLFYFLIG